MKRFLITLSIIFSSVILFAQTADDQNYKLGNFKDTQVKAKTVNIGGSWTVGKNSTSKGLDFYYGNTVVANITTTGQLDLSSAVCSAASFTATETRVAVYISGATTSDIYFVSPKGTAQSGVRAVAGDLLNWYPATDSLIVTRAAGTTSTLTFSYIRFK